jgi:hypothetical protein
MDMKKLIEYIKNDPTLKIAALERAANVPTNTLQNVLNAENRELPSRHAANILEALITLRGGIIKIGDNFFQNLEHQDFLVWGIAEEFDSVEVETEGGVYVKYPVNLFRINVDEFDLSQFLS